MRTVRKSHIEQAFVSEDVPVERVELRDFR